MCGIVLCYNKEINETELIGLATKASKYLSHRGPDDKGLWCESSCVIGHRRLSIIDVEGSRQPMTDPSKRYILSYNGEVYNFKEIRKTLEHRWDFTTKGDTEVVLAGLIIHGDSFLKRMEGMWAIALWDKKNETLLLSRDRMGQKPLFYQYDNNNFACASELTSLASLSSSPLQEDLNSTTDYLRYGYYLPGTTAYKGVYEVLPGHVLKWSPNRGIKQTPYWSLSFGDFSGSKKEAQEMLRERLIRAVNKRMVADVEVGAFLSGGVDSSLIVSILSKELGFKLKTFTIGFAEASYDERKWAKLVSRLCATDHFEQGFEDWDREELVKLILKNLGQPFADASLLPTAMVSSVASSKVKVVLSGDGGDELFSGYQRYQARVLLRWYTRLPGSLKKVADRLIRTLPEPMSHHSRSVLKKAHLFLDIVDRQESETPYVAPVLYSRSNFQKLVPELDGKGHPQSVLPTETRGDSLLEMMISDAMIYLPQDILTKVDRASMAFSLEARAPFLDHEVVELAFSLPIRWHRRGFSGKRMLKETFSYLLPDTIWRRRKQGFGVPLHKWFRSGLEMQLVELLEQLNTPFESSYVRQMLQTHFSGKRDHGYRLWNIYVYLLWLYQRSWQKS